MGPCRTGHPSATRHARRGRTPPRPCAATGRRSPAARSPSPAADPAGTADRHRTREATTIERTLALVGDRWTILVLRAAFPRDPRFDGFCADLDIARPILAARLRKLVDAGVMAREPFQRHPPRSTTGSPRSASPSPRVVALVRWGDRHLSTAPPSTMLVHGASGPGSSRASGARRFATTFAPVRSTAPAEHVRGRHLPADPGQLHRRRPRIPGESTCSTFAVALVARHDLVAAQPVDVLGLAITSVDPGIAASGCTTRFSDRQPLLEIVRADQPGHDGRALPLRHHRTGGTSSSPRPTGTHRGEAGRQLGIRIVGQFDDDGFTNMQLHPAAPVGSFLEIDQQEGGDDRSAVNRPAASGSRRSAPTSSRRSSPSSCSAPIPSGWRRAGRRSSRSTGRTRTACRRSPSTTRRCASSRSPTVGRRTGRDRPGLLGPGHRALQR